MSLADKLADVFNEPACDRNRAKDATVRRKGCGKPLTPGAAAGGCAFDGAKIVLQPITDAAHLVHGPLACEGNGWDNRGSLSSGPTLYRTGFTTDLSELDIIMGNGEKRLFKAIREIAEAHRPAAVFVYQTCVPALTGDDVEAVCKAAAERFGLPVIPVNVPGFVGSKNLGNKLAGETLLDHVIGTMEPEVTTPTDINIIGDFNLAGELWQVEPLFRRLGIRILARMTGDARYAEIAGAHRARLNLMICSMALINVARKMEERWGIPYAEVSFYGIEDTSAALRTCARLLVERGAPPDLIARTEALIAEEEAKARSAIAVFRPAVEGRRVLLYTGGVKSWSVVSALQELGMVVTGTSVRKSTEQDKARIQEIMGEDAHTFETIPPKEMYRMLKESEADIMLSGGRSQFVALKSRTPWLDINQERHRPYAGYTGLVELVRDLATELGNPVWAEVRAPAPWEPGSGAEPDEAPGTTPVRLATAAHSRNPLKSSQPLGAALAFMGLDRAMPLLHGSQGCTSFALVLAVRHFRENIPLQTTAMNEVTTILGGADNLEQAIHNLRERAKPRVIGIATTALMETRGEDIAGDLRLIRQRRPEFADTRICLVSTPDYDGAIETGWGKAVHAMVEEMVPAGAPGAVNARQVNILPGSHLTAADIDELRDMVAAFGLVPVVVPDIGGSLDGHIPDAWSGSTNGGATVEDVAGLARGRLTLAVGEQMRAAAEALERRAGVPFRLLPSLTGLRATDRLVRALLELTGGEVPRSLKRQRSQLQDALLDGHFYLEGRRVALAGDPDLLYALSGLFRSLGAEISVAVASTDRSPLLARIEAPAVHVGDLGLCETLMREAGADLLATTAHGRQAAERLGIPLLRAGFPVFDRLGPAHLRRVGYRGTRDLVFEAANLLLGARSHHHDTKGGGHDGASVGAH
ncbi:bifunctional nitrogenase iron-molybdenum cofactor biosynthesis protein NifEN [Rhodocista pekingensis]|uniref:Nitrogenase iron-molybdenum cofactor biosynthesis protein NifE n=1 Tax=Rhodocista pekingensis TaxID=201185 RepID=A0ABW2KQP9_9PROT